MLVWLRMNLRNIDVSPSGKTRITTGAHKLGQFFHRVVSCRLIIEIPDRRRDFAASSLYLALASMSSVPVRAQDSSDTQRGLSLARQVCSECHAIDSQQLNSPNLRAPTFPELAATPGMTNTALTVALTTPHAGMPMFRLSVEQRAAIIAYILSLGRGGSQPGE